MFDRKIIRFLFNNFSPHIIIKRNFQNVEEIFITSSQKDPVVTDRHRCTQGGEGVGGGHLMYPLKRLRKIIT
jgi:hypothetical protein